MNIEVIQKFRKRLENLECPFVYEGSADCWIEEMLFKPNETRYKLYNWLLTSYSPNFSASTKDDLADAVFEDLLCFGFVDKQDKDVILGKAPHSQQIQLWNKLLTLIEFNAKLPVGMTTSTFESCSWEISKFCEKVPMLSSHQAFINPNVKIFQPDIELMMKKIPKVHDSHVDTIQDLDNLNKRIQSLTTDLQKLEVKICSSSKSSDLAASELSIVNADDISKKYKSLAVELKRVLQNFCSLYKLELEFLIQSNKYPEVLPIGEKFIELHKNLSSVTQVMKSLHILPLKLEESDSLDANLQEISNKIMGTWNEEFIEQLENNIQIMKDALVIKDVEIWLEK